MKMVIIINFIFDLFSINFFNGVCFSKKGKEWVILIDKVFNVISLIMECFPFDVFWWTNVWIIHQMRWTGRLILVEDWMSVSERETFLKIWKGRKLNLSLQKVSFIFIMSLWRKINPIGLFNLFFILFNLLNSNIGDVFI